MSTVRAKFVVQSKLQTLSGTDEGFVVSLYAVHSGSEENKEFFKWTPNGTIQLGTINPEAAKVFEVAKECYVDFTFKD